MTEDDKKRASLEDIRRMKMEGELHHDPAAPEGEGEGEDLEPELWAKAQVKG